MKVAIFDFDGTLYPEETFSLMMKHLKIHPVHNKKYRTFFSKILPVYIAYKCKLYPEQKMKEYSMQSYLSPFASTSKDEVEQFFFQLGETMRDTLSKPVLERLEQHVRDGYYIMLVSGAFEPLLYSVTEGLKFDCIVGTNIPYTNQSLDSHTRIVHVQGERKKEKIYAQLKNYEVDWKNSYAYGDSYSDMNVLELVGNPVAVKPEPRLLQVAQERQWEVLA